MHTAMPTDTLSLAPQQVLSDDNKKSIYDRYGEAGLKGGMGGMSGGGGQGDFSNPFDILESFFGSGMGRQGASKSRPVPGEDERCVHC